MEGVVWLSGGKKSLSRLHCYERPHSLHCFSPFLSFLNGALIQRGFSPPVSNYPPRRALARGRGQMCASCLCLKEEEDKEDEEEEEEQRGEIKFHSLSVTSRVPRR